MSKKANIVVGEIIALFILYVVSAAFEETISILVNDSLTGDFAFKTKSSTSPKFNCCCMYVSVNPNSFTQF